MEMELYNTTDKTKVIPKFNYEGKMTMGPHESKKIEDYMAPFYKPYAKVGIVARPITRMGTFTLKDIEPEVAEVVKEEKAEEIKSVEEVKAEPEVKEEESTVEQEPVVEEVKEEEPVEEKEEEVKKYTKDKLTSMSVKNLKILAESLNVDVSNVSKKADIVKAILDSQK